MPEICREVQEWIEEEVEKPVTTWVDKEEKRCKRRKCKWYCGCCNKWFCWFVTVTVKVVKWVVVTVGKWVTRVVCETLVGLGGAILAVAGFVLGLVFAIPVIGRFLKGLWNLLILEPFWRLVGVFGTILDLLGLEFEKKLRICVLVLLEDGFLVPAATRIAIEKAIEDAKVIYKREANVKLIAGPIKAARPSPPGTALVVGCGAGAAWEDMTIAGSYFELAANLGCFMSSGRRVLGLWPPVTVFGVRTVKGDTAGCSIPWTDYVTIERDNPICLAHEVAHACWLPHDDSDRANLLHPTCGGTQLKKWQKIWLRNSRFVTYF